MSLAEGIAAFVTSHLPSDPAAWCKNYPRPKIIHDALWGTFQLPDNQMYLSEIIHGPFDADKLDYMPRDGMFSGLKMHVDMDRLFTSIDIITSKDDDRTMTRLAGTVAGISPLMQIMFNKMLLFTGI